MEIFISRSLGIDLIEIKRIRNILKKHPNFLEKMFGNLEYQEMHSRNFKVNSIAGNFCAKEAFFKAIGTGLFRFYLKDVEILRNNLGAPYINLSKKIINKFKLENVSFSLSITHTREYACAVVLCDNSSK